MATGTELAAAIGTWVAVVLAFIALVGVLPSYLLYQTSNTTKAQALNLVGDPDQSFVVRQPFLPGVPLKGISRIPDLREPPKLQAASWICQPDMRELRVRESTTC